MKIEEFEQAIRKDDFAIGDSLWLGDWEFEVVNRRNRGKPAEEEAKESVSCIGIIGGGEK